MTENIDTLIAHGHLLTMRGAGVGHISDGAIAIKGTRIVEVGPAADLGARYAAREVIDATSCVVLPGLIDAHMHTSLALLRGVAQDVSHWMQKALAPYSRHLTPEASAASTMLNTIEALKAGTTTHGDYGAPYPGWGVFHAKVGVRACLTPLFNALPVGEMAAWRVGDLYPFDLAKGRDAMDEAVSFARDWNGAADGRITTMLGVHAPDMMPVEMLLEAKEIAQREGWMLHVHTAQGARETEQIVKRYGKRPVAFLQEIGYLDPQLLAVHLTDATVAEAELVARSGAGMVVCSGSIGIIDGIVPPAHAFREAGGTVALGSDQACGNNCNNIFNEMKLTALFNKIRYANPTIMPAWDVLRMATIEGARAVGLEKRLGSLEAGKEADIILVDLTAPNLSPLLLDPIRNIVPNLVYAATGYEVRTVMIAGRIVMRDRQVLTADEAAIRAEAQEQAEALEQRVSADPQHEAMALMQAMRSGQL